MKDENVIPAEWIAELQAGASPVLKDILASHESLRASLATARDAALEEAALIADQHWPEAGHVHQPDAISCQMSISIAIRRLKSA